MCIPSSIATTVMVLRTAVVVANMLRSLKKEKTPMLKRKATAIAHCARERGQCSKRNGRRETCTCKDEDKVDAGTYDKFRKDAMPTIDTTQMKHTKHVINNQAMLHKGMRNNRV